MRECSAIESLCEEDFHHFMMGDYELNESIKNQQDFFNYYLTERYLFWYRSILKNCLNDTLRFYASGIPIVEYACQHSNRKVICSDLTPPKSLKKCIEILGDIDYQIIDIKNGSFQTKEKGNCHIFLSVFNLFDEKESTQVITKLAGELHIGDQVVIEIHASRPNFFSFIYYNIFLVFEEFLVFLIKRFIFRKAVEFRACYYGNLVDDRQLVKICSENGLVPTLTDKFFHDSDWQRSRLLRDIGQFNFAKNIFRWAFRNSPRSSLLFFEKS